MKPHISHSFEGESKEAKARWFQSLSLEERMKIFVNYTDLILGINPSITEKKDAKPVKGRILVVRKPSS